MHAQIMQWSSDALYGGRVRAAPEVASHLLSDLPTVRAPEDGIVIALQHLTAVRAASAADIAERIAEAADSAATLLSATATASKAGGAVGGWRLHRVIRWHHPQLYIICCAESLLPAADDVTLDAATLLAPMLLVDTAGCLGMEELQGKDGPGGGKGTAGTMLRESKSNPGEADVVLKHLLALRTLGVPAADIAVVTPYNAQVALISALVSGSGVLAGIEVRSVDSFQGRRRKPSSYQW